MIGSRVSHYEILERLGGGGMGVVYKARDLRLDRIVALKFLSPQRTVSDAGRRRFLREARAVSALDHPNLCALHEIGETEEDGLFLAMAFCSGETLKARIERGPLPLAEAVEVAGQIAAGLASAHERGIVHRDVKPANVILSPEGRVKLVDFGIAKFEDGATVLTREGTSLGTPAYMSPEQLRGLPLDGRSDIWSLGVVLYEMLTARLPFQGGSDREVVHAILRDRPVPVSKFLPGVPPGIERVLERALASSPDARYGRIEEMGEDLRIVAAGGVPEDGAPTLLDAGERGRPTLPAVPSRRTVSHFQILEPLGGGGMGVVYRAEDTRLGRPVALKFLAPELVRDRDAKVRFLTEARSASALDHPNVCTILEVGEDEEGQLFLAMPCYEGESLEHRLGRGPLPVEEALDVAVQAARGLAKAHRHGIVHRDVKPANLFLTSDGMVKILDFGIAKLAGSAGPTRRGAFLGTPAYMSPEQARGEEVDARADVWSLGVVLYEMLAGRRPFTGGVDAAVVHAVLHEEPEPLARLCPEVPREVERLVQRMLAKDPGQRHADAAELLEDLKKALDLSMTGTVTLPAAPPPRRWPAAALAAVLVLAGGVLGFLAWRGTGGEAPLQASFTQLTDAQGRETFPALSPDGSFFAYAKAVDGSSDVFLQRVGGGKVINLTADSPANDTQPAFSPDGSQIAFRSERDGGGIFLMGATGESVRRLTDFGFNPSWSPDGREIAVATEAALDPAARYSRSQIYRVDVATGAARPLGVDDGVQPAWSPHRLRIAFWGLAQPGARRVIWTLPVDGGPAVAAVDDVYYNWSPAWAPDGRSLYFASNRGGSMNLWRVPIDERSGKVLGDPRPVTTPAEWSALPSLSRDGRHLLYATNDSRSFVEQVPFDPVAGKPAGPPALVLQGTRWIRSCDVSPDGAWLALWATAPQEDVLLVRPDGRDLRQLTNDPARDRVPHWSPDGRRILFSSNRGGKYEAWTLRPDGSGLTQLTSLPYFVTNPVWSPDGQHIAFTYGPKGTSILDLRGPATGPPRMLPAQGGLRLARAAWSGDGRWLAGQLMRQDESPVPGIVLWSLADNSHRRLTQTGDDPLFSHDGSRIFFIETGAVRLLDLASREERTLLAPPLHSSYKFVDAGPGDRSLCTVRSTDEGDVWLLSFVDSGKSSE